MWKVVSQQNQRNQKRRRKRGHNLGHHQGHQIVTEGQGHMIDTDQGQDRAAEGQEVELNIESQGQGAKAAIQGPDRGIEGEKGILKFIGVFLIAVHKESSQY